MSLFEGDTATGPPSYLFCVAKLPHHALQGQPTLVIEFLALAGLLEGLYPDSYHLESEGTNNTQNHNHNDDFYQSVTMVI